MQITIVLSTARKERKSERVFKALVERFSVHKELAVESVDIREHVQYPATLPPWASGGADEEPTKWKEIVKRTDAFVFVIPEYNHSYPGEWKLLVDQLYDEYTGKPAYIVSVSRGQFAGVRMAEHIKPVLVDLNFRVVKISLFVSKVGETFSEEGDILDEKTGKRVEKFVDQVIQGT